MREIKGHKFQLGIEYLVLSVRDNRNKYLQVGAYAQILAEIDSAIDEIALRLLQHNYYHLESQQLLGNLASLRILDGNKIVTLLEKNKIIKSSLQNKIKDFKSARGKIIHDISGIKNLLHPEERRGKLTLEERKDAHNAFQKRFKELKQKTEDRFNELIKKGDKILDNLVEISYQNYADTYEKHAKITDPELEANMDELYKKDEVPDFGY